MTTGMMAPVHTEESVGADLHVGTPRAGWKCGDLRAAQGDSGEQPEPSGDLSSIIDLLAIFIRVVEDADGLAFRYQSTHPSQLCLHGKFEKDSRGIVGFSETLFVRGHARDDRCVARRLEC